MYPKNSGIYIIHNIINDKIYVGSAKSLSDRIKRHKSLLRTLTHPNSHLRASCYKYGIASFQFLIHEIIEDPSNLIEREQYWIDTLKPEYNLAPRAGNQLGFKHSEESLKKMSVASRSRGARPPSRKGVSPSPEAIEKQAAKLRGKKRDPAIGRKISASKIGFKFSKESRLKMSLAKIGNKNRSGKK